MELDWTKGSHPKCELSYFLYISIHLYVHIKYMYKWVCIGLIYLYPLSLKKWSTYRTTFSFNCLCFSKIHQSFFMGWDFFLLLIFLGTALGGKLGSAGDREKSEQSFPGKKMLLL